MLSAEIPSYKPTSQDLSCRGSRPEAPISPHRLERGFRVAVATFSRMRCSADRRAGSLAKGKIWFRGLRCRAAHKPAPTTPKPGRAPFGRNEPRQLGKHSAVGI